jgi:hypothetical protein
MYKDQKRRAPSLRRAVSLASVGALALTAAPAGLAAAQVEDDGPEPRDTNFVCQPPYESEDDFDDVDEDNVHAESIWCAADYEIALGKAGEAAFDIRADVRRDQMASFIARWVEHAIGEDLPEGDASFDDVDEDNVHGESINKLAEAGIVLGRDESTYDPAGDVNRDAMASFIARGISYLDNEEAQDGSEPPADDSDYFDDVDEDNTHVEAINALAGQGVVAGDEDGNYNPRAEVRRDQMPAFIMRGYDYAVEAGLVTSPLLPINGGNGDDGDHEEGPQAQQVGTLAADRIEVFFDGGVTVIDADGFEVFDDDACTNHVAHGTATLGDGGPLIDVTLSEALDGETDYWFQLAAGAVEDGDGLANAASDCLEVQGSPIIGGDDDNDDDNGDNGDDNGDNGDDNGDDGNGDGPLPS